MYKRCLLSALFLGLWLSRSVQAQDGHYWTQQYGTKSMLLSGAVIGGVEDLGAIYYNPGRLGLIENPAFLLSADVYEWERLRVFNAADETGKKSSSDFGGVPSMVAGSFRLGFLEGHQFAYGILQRSRSDLDVSFEEESFGELLPGFPGEEHFRGVLDLEGRSREDWFSLAWSYPFSKRYSIGITTSGVRYSQRKENLIDLSAHTADGKTAIFNYQRNLRFERYGLLWKAGLAAAYDRWWLGLTVTTPTIGLMGKGRFGMQLLTSNLPEQEDLFVTTDQEDLTARHKRPWSVGAGATYRLKRGNIHLSAEWYSRVPHYVMLQADDYIGQSDGETYQFALYDELKSIVNAGIGLEYAVGEKLSLFASCATDFSVVDTSRTTFSEMKPIAASSIFSADMLNVGGGFILKVKGVDLTLGVTHTGGWETFRRVVNFPDEGDTGPVLPEEGEEGRLRWSRWRIVFGFQVPFLKSKVAQLEGGL